MTPLESFLIIVNPVAGSGRGSKTATAVRDLLRKQNLSCEIAPTSHKGHAQTITTNALANHQSQNPLCIVACGGDGTMQEVANAIAEDKSKQGVMGIAPAGRCNDFARALSIPTDPEDIAQTLANEPPRPIDLGRAGNRYFCTIAALGFDAAVSRFVNEMRMPLKGPIAYVYGTLRKLMTYRAVQMTVKGDFGQHTGPVFMAATANTSCYGGAMRIAPQATPFDGVLDICLVGQVSRLRVIRMLTRVMAGTHESLRELRMVKSTTISFELQDTQPIADSKQQDSQSIADPSQQASRPIDQQASRPIVEVWADGEPIGRLPIKIQIAPQAILAVYPTVPTPPSSPQTRGS
jgi:diacylglycerol kinase (ATP)